MLSFCVCMLSVWWFMRVSRQVSGIHEQRTPPHTHTISNLPRCTHGYMDVYAFTLRLPGIHFCAFHKCMYERHLYTLVVSPPAPLCPCLRYKVNNSHSHIPKLGGRGGGGLQVQRKRTSNAHPRVIYTNQQTNKLI